MRVLAVPFTFAHPAAAVPLLRPLGRNGSLSALVIGSMAPDLAFIVALDLTREQTHSLAALFLFCLPAGLLAYLLFHALLKAPLIDLMPDAIASRLAGAMEARRAPWSAVLVSMLCGALTHLLWDAFTHPGTPVVNALPLLQTELAVVGGYHVVVFKLLQHGSSLVGLALLALWAINWLRRAPVVAADRARLLSPLQRIGALLMLAAIPLLAGLHAGWQRSAHVTNMVELQEFATGFIFTALPAGALLLAIYSMLWKLATARGR
ncbi:MAG: DUF4184 family protein [Telluria sp.]